MARLYKIIDKCLMALCQFLNLANRTEAHRFLEQNSELPQIILHLLPSDDANPELAHRCVSLLMQVLDIDVQVKTISREKPLHILESMINSPDIAKVERLQFHVNSRVKSLGIRLIENYFEME